MIPELVAIIARTLAGGPLDELSEEDERECIKMAWSIYHAVLKYDPKVKP